MDCKVFLDKIEDVFFNLGFRPIMINGVKYMRYNELYCKITFIEDWSAFVIESADNVQDVEKGVLEDGDLYYTDMSEREFLDRLKSDLLRYYLTD